MPPPEGDPQHPRFMLLVLPPACIRQRDLRQISSLLPLMCAQTSLVWDPVVLVNDSSEVRYGVLERDVGADCAGRWGR
eukprot:6945833-Heterocapsa_arctica.AAC.1